MDQRLHVRNRVGYIKNKVKLHRNKENGTSILFRINCNGVGPRNRRKVDQLIKINKDKKTHDMLASSTGTIWTSKTIDVMMYMLKQLKRVQ